MKFINQSIIVVSLFAIVLLLSSCGQSNPKSDTPNSSEETALNAEARSQNQEEQKTGIHLTRKQVETMKIQLGDFSQIKINDFVSAKGTLGLPPNALTSVSAKANGFIKGSKKYVEGSYVKKGGLMAYLENPEFIQQQKEYLELAASLVFDRQELARQSTLMEADAGIEKNVQKLQADINVKMATMKGIELQLGYLGIDVDKLSLQNIIQRIPIYAPIAGYVTSVTMHDGMYVIPELTLVEIVNVNDLHLELNVFEKDIANVRERQPISYTIPALGNTVFQGEVDIIGKEFNPQNKTVCIYGRLLKKHPRFIKGLFVEGKIWLNDQTVDALPETAIVKDGASTYIYVTNDQMEGEELIFEPIKVIEGLSDKGFTAVILIDDIPTKMKIVTDGAYFVYAQSKSGELKEND